MRAKKIKHHPADRFVYGLYRLFSSAVFFIFFPFFWLYTRITGRYREGLGQRAGIYRTGAVRQLAGGPIIWLHAVSVGEINVAGAIIDRLRNRLPGCCLIVSTTTEQGFQAAVKTFGTEATCIHAPLDSAGAVRRALATLQPDILVCLETEIWPNWLNAAHKKGVKIALLNGRISMRTINHYMKIRPLIRTTLAHVDAFSMIQTADADRITRLGAAADRITVNGNAKFDVLQKKAAASIKPAMRQLYNVKKGQVVLVAGSVRNREDRILLGVYQKIVQIFPKALLIIAPRHIGKAAAIGQHVGEHEFSCQYRSALGPGGHPRTASVVVVDTMGELMATYSIATLAFCGGSLVPLGGQNILEAAVWGIPVFFGPSMEDFLDAKALLGPSGGIQVADGRELADKMLYYLNHPEKSAAAGQRARKAVVTRSGAADKHADVICRVLAPKK
jgi:3-deoxy-D-manno-octulosonic-acid transferase